MYFGRRDGWTLSPPYSTLFRIRGGTNRPNETAMIRFIGPSGAGGNYTGISKIPITLGIYTYVPACESFSFMDSEPQLLCNGLNRY